MDYSSKLFGVIPYSIRDGETPTYSDTQVEKMLSDHYGSVFAPMIYVTNVFHDNRNNGGVLIVDYFINYGESNYQWFGQVNGDQEDGIALEFQSYPIKSGQSDYAYQLFIALQKHFTHDSQLTIIHPDDINTTYSKEDQIRAYNSAKSFIEHHKDFFDQLIKNDTPAMISFYLRASLAGIDVYFKDSADDILKKLEQNLRSKENIIKRACKELGITQKELAEKLGVDDGTVRKWASEATKTPEWAEKFIALIIEHDKTIKGIEHFKYFLESVGVRKSDG